MLESLDDLTGAISGADPSEKALIYSELGVCATYYPEQRTLVAEVLPSPCTKMRVGGPIHMNYNWRIHSGL